MRGYAGSAGQGGHRLGRLRRGLARAEAGVRMLEAGGAPAAREAATDLRQSVRPPLSVDAVQASRSAPKWPTCGTIGGPNGTPDLPRQPGPRGNGRAVADRDGVR